MRSFFLNLVVSISFIAVAQKNELSVVDAIYSNALTNMSAYNNLYELCTKAPGRLMGSKESGIALQLLSNKISELKPDTFFQQNYITQSWRCKQPAKAVIFYNGKKENLNVVNLGLSVSTPNGGIKAEVVEVTSMKQLDSIGFGVKGKIVFFNRPMDNTELNTFHAYSGAVDQRSSGAARAAAYGSIGVLIRSLSTEADNFPHTGVSRYKDGVKEIPNLSISTNDANKLSEINSKYKDCRVWIQSNTETLDNVSTANLIAEIKGSEHPEKIILIGAHTDAWFNTPGAHDDGAGCVQMIDVIRIFKQLNLHPKNTIRIVLYMDEEMHQSGSKQYASFVELEKKEHIACIESDAGGALPLGFGIDANDSIITKIHTQAVKLTNYGIFNATKGYGGVDIAPLKKFGFPLIGLTTNSQRYFEYHHCANDTPDKVSRRELQMGTAAIASLVYLIDKNGI